jgi:hypothetical protein
MYHTTFETFVRRTANLRDRRSFLGSLGAAFLALVALPRAAAGKNKHHRKKHQQGTSCHKEQACRHAVLPGCDLATEIPHCKNRVQHCCHKACTSENDAVECIDDIGF